MTKKNDPCPCESGLPYKYCHIASDLPNKTMMVPLDPSSRIYAMVDMTRDMINIEARAQLPLKYYCKDNGFYYFSMAITIGDAEELRKQLKTKALTVQNVLDMYIKNTKEEGTMKLLEEACTETPLFNKRKKILIDGFKLHFEGRYTSSIPTLIPQLEGILREYGKLENKSNIRPVIPVEVWNEEVMYMIADDAQNFNSYIHKLFEGGKDENAFNRNPILHGFKIDYHSKEHSLMILLAIMEIRLFIWWERCFGFRKTAATGIINALKGRLKENIGRCFIWQNYTIDIFQF